MRTGPTLLSQLEILSRIIAALLLPIMIAGVGHVVTRSVTEPEIQSRFVEIALNLLRQATTDENRTLRLRTTEIVDRFSNAPLSSEAKNDRVSRVTLVSARIDLSGLHGTYSLP